MLNRDFGQDLAMRTDKKNLRLGKAQELLQMAVIASTATKAARHIVALLLVGAKRVIPHFTFAIVCYLTPAFSWSVSSFLMAATYN